MAAVPLEQEIRVEYRALRLHATCRGVSRRDLKPPKHIFHESLIYEEGDIFIACSWRSLHEP